MQCKQHPCQAHYHDYDACGFLLMSVQGYCCTDSSNSAAASSNITVKMHIYAMVGGFECVDFELHCCSDAVMPCPSFHAHQGLECNMNVSQHGQQLVPLGITGVDHLVL